ncbi:MAG: heparinase II/III family protein [Roseivivax sp.]|nr:heparinase II/III family protein [Roseivivax sp.]
MSTPDGWRARWARMMNRWHARRACRFNVPTPIVLRTEPRSIGSFARGRQLCSGNLQFAGHLIEADDAMIWDLDPPGETFIDEIHASAWLDDLAAAGDLAARELAHRWVWGWIARYGRGKGAGWAPDLAGRRVIRWLHHRDFLLRGRPEAEQAEFTLTLARQVRFLSRRWYTAAPGLSRFEALGAVVLGGLMLKDMAELANAALGALEIECARRIDDQGGLPTRSPEELLDVLSLLTWVTMTLDDAHRPQGPELRRAIERIAPTLRTLRHADGGLARFHGGGRGLDGRLDLALAASGVKKRQADGLAMGFARLSAARTSVIVDAAPPPQGDASLNAHASTLAFELTSGRRPLIVNCGAGGTFGAEWRRAGRATPSHSTLTLDGYSSARLGRMGRIGASRLEMLEDTPQKVPAEVTHPDGAFRLEAAHDGYLPTHGLTHARTLDLSADGRGMTGEDLLIALSTSDKRSFDRQMDATDHAGVPLVIRFHLHPEVDAEIDLGGSAVSMVLRSSEVWVFRHDDAAKLTLEPSVYLEKGRLRPRATKQIVLSGHAMGYATRIRWSLTKAQETASAIRDLVRDELELTR